MTFINYIKVNGEYHPQEELPEDILKEAADELQIRFMEVLGFVPKKTKEKTA